MEKLPRRRPAGHPEPQQKLRNGIPGLIVDHAVSQVNNFLSDVVDFFNGGILSIFNIGGVFGRILGTEQYTYREVVRLDNRIDSIADELGVVQIATYGYSDRWWKPAGAYGDIVIDCIGGASGGGRSNNGGSGGAYRGGLGGWSGGWDKKIIPHDQCPPYIDIVVGETAPGATSDGGHGTTGKTTTFYAPDGTILAQATGGDSASRKYGEGNNTYRVRGGNGGADAAAGSDIPSSNGGAGSFDPGGKGGALGQEGENGFSVPAAKVGVGSGGGGGGQASLTGSGSRGGDGGWPSGPGGGGGGYTSFGFAGNGGMGSAGAGYISTRISDTRITPPSVPTGLAATAVAGTTATITWTPSTDDFRVDQYEVLVNNVVRGYTENTNFPLAGLTPSTAYAVKLRAVDDNGNWSAFSSVLNFTTTA